MILATKLFFSSTRLKDLLIAGVFLCEGMYMLL